MKCDKSSDIRLRLILEGFLLRRQFNIICQLTTNNWLTYTGCHSILYLAPERSFIMPVVFIPKLEYIEGKIYEQRNENGRFCF